MERDMKWLVACGISLAVGATSISLAPAAHATPDIITVTNANLLDCNVDFLGGPIGGPQSNPTDGIGDPRNEDYPYGVACKPEVIFPQGSTSLLTDEGFRVQFGSFTDSTMGDTLNGPDYGAAYGVYGFVDSPDKCTPGPGQTRWFLDRDVTKPITVGNGLTLQIFQRASNSRIGVNQVGQLGSGSASPLPVQRIFLSTSGVSLNSGSNAGKFFCAMSGTAVVNDGNALLGLSLDYFTANTLSPKLLIPVRERTVVALQPGKPTLVPPGQTGPVDVMKILTVRTGISGPSDVRAVSRLLFIGAADASGAACTGTPERARYYVDRTSRGTGEDRYDFAITASDWAGRFLCMYQKVVDTRGVETVSEVAYVPINALTAASPQVKPLVNFNLAGTISSIQSVSAALRRALQAPQVNEAEVARLRAEAEALERQAQQAINNGALNANPNQNQGGAPAAATPEKLLEELGNLQDLVAPGGNPRSALELATGYDQVVTPLIPLGSRTAAGLELVVTSPDKVKRGRNMKVTVGLDPADVRGRMRLFLIRYEGETPVVVLKRVGFISQGAKSKTFRVPRTAPPGEYALLTTLQPTTPGQVGVATLTPLRVTR